MIKAKKVWLVLSFLETFSAVDAREDKHMI